MPSLRHYNSTCIGPIISGSGTCQHQLQQRWFSFIDTLSSPNGEKTPLYIQFQRHAKNLPKLKLISSVGKILLFNYVVISSFTCKQRQVKELHRQNCKIVRSRFEIHANSAINRQKPRILDSLVPTLLMRTNILHNMDVENWKRKINL